MTDKILFTDDIISITRLTRQTISRFINENRFPKPFKIGNRNAWCESKITQWINDLSTEGKQ